MNGSEGKQTGRSTLWVSVHQCPSCHHSVDLGALDLGAVTSGIVSCPKCEWAGRIEIRVVDSNSLQM
jgi:hypothetical protein